jgi:GMP synthase (glutamine-hydrolysing)
VKPFLLLATRAEDAAADNEYEPFLALAGLDEGTTASRGGSR